MHADAQIGDDLTNNDEHYAADISETSGDESSESLSSYGTTDSDTSTRSYPYHEEDTLPPTDRGTAAWLTLAGCFWVDGLVWGFPFSYGVFEKYYSNHENFSSKSGIAAIGTTGNGFACFLAPVVIALLQRWPSQRKNVSVVGLAIMTVALVAASFAKHVIQLILTQGALYGVGGAMTYCPVIFYLDEWFIARKGMAYGIFWAGGSLCGAVIPFVMEWALNEYGFQVTLRAWAVFVVISLSLVICWFGPRRPLPSKGVVNRVDLEFLRKPVFWAFQIGNFIEALGFYMPQIYLPSFAVSIGLSSFAATLSISLLNATSTIGFLLMGFLTDQYHITTVLAISALTTALSVFLPWGFATTAPTLYLFSIFFGIFAGGYTASWTGCATEVQKANPDTAVTVVIGTMAAGRGIGCVLSGPLSEYLLRLGTDKAVGAYGTRYGSLILFTGFTALLGGFGLFGRLEMRAGKAREGDRRRSSESERAELLA